jgi:dienelactone hydrolase
MSGKSKTCLKVCKEVDSLIQLSPVPGVYGAALSFYGDARQMKNVFAGICFCLVVTASTIHAEDSAQRAEVWKKIESLFSPLDEFKGKLAPHRPLLKFEDGSPVNNAADWQKRRQELLAYWHKMLGPWPAAINKPRVEYLEKESLPEFTRHKVKIEVAPERTTIAYLLVPPGKGPFPAVLDVFYTPEGGAGVPTGKEIYHDFGATMARRGFVALCVGLEPVKTKTDIYFPNVDAATLQPLSYLAYVSGNCRKMLAALPEVDPKRIGVVGHSYGGKWSLFSGALNEEFAAVAISDPGIVFDEPRSNVNYWEPWYLGYETGKPFRKRGILSEEFPRVGPYKQIVADGRDLHELHALIAPRPFFVSAGAEDPPSRWMSLNHSIAVNKLLGVENRVGMSNRPAHSQNRESREQIALFFEYFLKHAP